MKHKVDKTIFMKERIFFEIKCQVLLTLKKRKFSVSPAKYTPVNFLNCTLTIVHILYYCMDERSRNLGNSQTCPRLLEVELGLSCLDYSPLFILWSSTRASNSFSIFLLLWLSVLYRFHSFPLWWHSDVPFLLFLSVFSVILTW